MNTNGDEQGAMMPEPIPYDPSLKGKDPKEIIKLYEDRMERLRRKPNAAMEWLAIFLTLVFLYEIDFSKLEVNENGSDGTSHGGGDQGSHAE